MKRTIVGWIGFVLLVIFSTKVSAQDISISINSKEVALNQYFQITLKIENERLKGYSPFPDIEGMVKRGTSSSSSTNIVNGQISSSQSIIQNYQPTKEGTFQVPDFTITANGKQVSIKGFTIIVKPPIQQQQRRDPFADPFDFFRQRNDQPTEFVDVDADAFLALTSDKKDVYVGEGFTATLAFYVAESNRAELRFYDLGNQVTEIIKQIKPASCWEENFNIESIQGEPTTINGRAYTQYKIYQAAYYPLNLEDITFPSLGLKMIKYKVAKNPSFFGRNRQEDYETFYSKQRVVKVKELPPHPLKERVAVGDYRLAEKINTLQLNTGQSFNYEFNVIGEGNISAIEEPILPQTEEFDFYAPNVKQNISRSEGRVAGTKNFSYYGIPNEPGEYKLGDYFQWVFFNPEKDEYDTLKSRQVVHVKGESRKNEYILSNDMGSFYDTIDLKENKLFGLDDSSWMRIFANLFIGAMLIATVILVFRK